MSLVLQPMLPERDRDAVARAVMLAFAGSPEGVRDWMTSAGEEHFRVLTDGTRALATLVRIPMGQFFGGASVPMLGIAGVAVAPEHRGGGNAKRMMQLAMQQAAAESWPLAGLYASTHSLYRAVGFEHAGYRFHYTIPIIRIDVRERAGQTSAIADADMPAVHDCYKRFARNYDGMLDRGPYIWRRIQKMREEIYQGFAVRADAARVDGYLFLTQRRRPDGRQDLALSDFAFTTPHAGRRLWDMLADFAPMGEELSFFGGPEHPVLSLLQQQRYRVELKDTWLIRVLNVKKALEARGYAPAVRAEVHLDVHDDLIPANHRRWVLRVAEGKGTVEPGGRGDLRLHARGLASIYSGFTTPAQARLLGWAEGSDAACAAAHCFASGTPWMTDMF